MSLGHDRNIMSFLTGLLFTSNADHKLNDMFKAQSRVINILITHANKMAS